MTDDKQREQRHVALTKLAFKAFPEGDFFDAQIERLKKTYCTWCGKKPTGVELVPLPLKDTNEARALGKYVAGEILFLSPICDWCAESRYTERRFREIYQRDDHLTFEVP